jgi:tetratricopeptide (TPR) repeat protein
VAARAELDRARATQRVLDAETLRVAALLAIDEADGDMSAGRALAERAVAQDPSSLRNRALLARCLIAGGEFGDARQHLAALGKLDPEHPVLAEVTAELNLADPAKSAKSSGKQPTRTAREPEPVPSGSTLPSEPVPARIEPAGAQAVKDPIELTRLGEAALERGAVQTAERDFQHALELDPHSARARTGLGYVALERGQPELAAAHFKPAARDGRAEALIGLGDAYRRLGRIRDALVAYQTYLHRYPNGTRSSIARRQSELLSEQLADGAR